MARRIRTFSWFSLATISCVLFACSSTTNPVSSREAISPPGFFERMADQLTERECNVGRFICPYGWARRATMRVHRPGGGVQRPTLNRQAAYSLVVPARLLRIIASTVSCPATCGRFVTRHRALREILALKNAKDCATVPRR